MTRSNSVTLMPEAVDKGSVILREGADWICTGHVAVASPAAMINDMLGQRFVVFTWCPNRVV